MGMILTDEVAESISKRGELERRKREKELVLKLCDDIGYDSVSDIMKEITAELASVVVLSENN